MFAGLRDMLMESTVECCHVDCIAAKMVREQHDLLITLTIDTLLFSSDVLTSQNCNMQVVSKHAMSKRCNG
jgi:5,10-methylene-tetrahydrofolate dehydrogenase/methenyl tetrahydrofolate cyclohydrolase